MPKILIAEDDVTFGGMVRDLLEHLHHSVELVHSGDEANDRLRLYNYDVVILDWDLPQKSGIEICRQYRAQGGQTAILMMTAKATLENKEEGLYGGADDYLTKPFHVKELAARVAALLRRAPAFTPDQLKLGDITLDAKEHNVTLAGRQIHLLPKEFALLETFMKHPNELLTTEALLEKIWSAESDTTTAVIKAHIYNLRKKLTGVQNPVIATVHGLGYRLETS